MMLSIFNLRKRTVMTVAALLLATPAYAQSGGFNAKGDPPFGRGSGSGYNSGAIVERGFNAQGVFPYAYRSYTPVRSYRVARTGLLARLFGRRMVVEERSAPEAIVKAEPKAKSPTTPVAEKERRLFSFEPEESAAEENRAGSRPGFLRRFFGSSGGGSSSEGRNTVGP